MTTTIAPIILGESNYIQWSKSVRSKIITSGNWDFVEGTPPSKPTLSATPTAAEHRELREWSKSNGSALGIILESLSEANLRIVSACTLANDAWTKLKTAHAATKGTAQFLRFQELALVRQKPGESLTAYHSRILLAGDALAASFDDKATVGDVISVLTTFTSLSQLEDTDANDSFVTSVTVNGVDSTTLPGLYAGEQARRDTHDRGKEAGLAASGGGRPSAPKPKCAHCSKAHNSNDCWKTFPEKMPEWLRLKNAEDRKKPPRSSPAVAARVSAPAHVSDDDSSDEEVAYAMAASLRSSQSVLGDGSDDYWIADTGATSHMTPHRHWLRNYKPLHIPSTWPTIKSSIWPELAQWCSGRC